MNESLFQARLKAFWADKMSYPRRLALCVLPCALLICLYTLFGPLEIVISSANDLGYSYHDILPSLLVLSLSGTLIVSLLMAVLRGRPFRWAVTLTFGVAAASYIQTNYANLDLGLLDGTAIVWKLYTIHSLTNLAMWLAVLAIPMLLLYFSPKLWKNAVRFLSALLIFMQLTGIVYQFATTDEAHSTGYLSGEKLFEVSDKQNVILFLLDNTSNECAEAAMALCPDIRDALHDFTYYNNANSNYRATFPGKLAWFTGSDLHLEKPLQEIFADAWHGSKANAFYDMLSRRGMKRFLFDELRLVALNDSDYIVDKFDNVVSDHQQQTLDYRKIQNLIKLVFFRNVPHIMKASFEVDTSEVAGAMVLAKNPEFRLDFSEALLARYASPDISVVEDNGRFMTHYMRGAHDPFTLDENGHATGAATDEVRQGAAYLRGIVKYIEALKEKGVYDDATIIISADHGSAKHRQFAFFIKEPYAEAAEMRVSTAPISPQQEFLGTIARILGEDMPELGPTIYDYAEDAQRERWAGTIMKDDNFPLVKKFGAVSMGSHNVFKVVTYTGDRTDLAQATQDSITFIPLAESIY